MVYVIEKNQKYETKKVVVYSYTNNANVNYEVFLTPNQLYPQKSLGEGKVYVTDLVDYIDTLFKYEFNGDGLGEITGKYNITAILEGFTKGFNNNKTLWQKEYVLQPDTDFSANDKTVLVQNKQPIYIKSYANYIKMALDTIKINFETNLIIKWNVSMEAKTDKGVIREKLTPSMVIPLNGQLIDITGNMAEQKNGTLDEMQQQISYVYKPKILACWIGEGIAVALLLFLFIFTAPLVISPLQKMQRRIFKNYGCRMVALDGELTINSKKIIEVLSFDDLVKIADDLNRPILYKNSTNLEDIIKYYIVGDQITYLFDINKSVLIDNIHLSESLLANKNDDCFWG